jgi:MFS family permease
VSGTFGVDLTPLRVSRSYRRLFAYRSVGFFAWEATYVALMYQLKQVTNSTLALGALGLVELLPLLLFGFYGGVLADHVDRRRIAVLAETGLCLSSAVLLVNSQLTHPSAALIYVVAALFAAFGSIQSPSVGSLSQQVVPHDLQRQSSTLSMIATTTAGIAGPALGGFVAVTVSVSAVFLADVVSFAVTIPLLLALPAGAAVASEGGVTLAAGVEGARYARRRADILGTYAIDLVAMFFAYPIAILPFMAERFHASYALAVLYCALPTGALITSVTSRWTTTVTRYGRWIVVAAAMWGIGIALFGLAPWLWVAFLALAFAGGCDAVSGIFRTAMWNESISPSMRGRMASIEMLSYSVGPTAGSFRAGVAATAWGLRASVVIGGLVCTTGVGAVAGVTKSLWRFDRASDPHVAAVAAERANDEFDA